MVRKVELSASLISADHSRLMEDTVRLVKAGADRIHCDISDGKLIRPLIFGPILIPVLNKVASARVDLHFWLERPEFQLTEYLSMMDKTVIKTVYFPLETCLKPFSLVEDIKNAGFKPGVCILPITPTSYAFPLLSYVEEIMVMTSDPTYEKRTTLPFTLGKIAELRKAIDENGYAAKIAVDGGIDQEFLPKVVGAGADVLVLGGIVFKQRMIEENIRQIREIIAKI